MRSHRSLPQLQRLSLRATAAIESRGAATAAADGGGGGGGGASSTGRSGDAGVAPAAAGGGGFDPSLLRFLVCPLAKTPLRHDPATSELVNDELGVRYPIGADGVPRLAPMYGRVADGGGGGKGGAAAAEAAAGAGAAAAAARPR
ncbi:hypothetical protein Rsub_04188 [Raphidocelis subcapitata]|uniref:Protein preY, mitochondrial n=1 Tax=Raphidocelis subcapitata TaxID=307507 RepID=A0A2V0NUY1_9CHLO|nr:hypothetical protein Rsub_04188 [Raphidocelis subcapitata]|eukprot:GBF91448.1 hypothetical protein Rsub_04188 [Raphidocelis subcapitata]